MPLLIKDLYISILTVTPVDFGALVACTLSGEQANFVSTTFWIAV